MHVHPSIGPPANLIIIYVITKVLVKLNNIETNEKDFEIFSKEIPTCGGKNSLQFIYKTQDIRLMVLRK